MTRIIGIGVDVVDLDRFAQSLKRTPTLRDRLFTEAEASLPQESLAGSFAAKEAFLKAVSTSGDIPWRDIEVVRDDVGAPSLELSGKAAAYAEDLYVSTVHLSISHDGGIATAFVIAESES